MAATVKWRVVIVVLLLFGAGTTLALAQLTQANFNAATGFSGRHGFTCTSCHTPGIPAAGNQPIAPPAEVHLDGLGDAWSPGDEWRLTIRVTGGPAALPNPAPRGGFEIEASAGSFSAPEDMVDLIDVYTPGAVTYTVAGTQVREWSVIWHAPEITGPPAPVTFWVAAMASNGNHVIAAGLADGGEVGDAVDNKTAAVPPSAAAIDEWESIRLEPPVIDRVEDAVAFETFRIFGHHGDLDATHLSVRINDGPWDRVATPVSWVVLVGPLPAGTHDISLRSETDDRASEVLSSVLTVEAAGDEAQTTPFPLTILLPFLFLLRRP